MRMYDLIAKKKHGGHLTDEEMTFLIEGFTKGTIPDYQMSAFLMAVCLKGMDEKETVAMTMAMAHSGEMLDLSGIHGIKVDKHSTGGVGDKTSLIVGPLVACLGIPVAKMSGRGLGHTGGTIDKLESFPGFRTTIPTEEFERNVNEMKLSIVGQTANLAPADKKIYALRDVTCTVDNLSLIASSIMSKKLASGADCIVLDVKTGSGAFMKTKEDSIALAEAMVSIGRMAGKTTYAVITDMNEPLGCLVGNALEVKEAICALSGEGPRDLMEVSLILAAFMTVAAGKAKTTDEARQMLDELIVNGKAKAKLKEFVVRQYGDGSYVDEPEKFGKPAYSLDVTANADGYVAKIDTEEVGMTSLLLGGGRTTKDSEIDLHVGIKLYKKLGDKVAKGEALGTLYANDETNLDDAAKRFANAYTISEQFVEAPTFIYGFVDEEGYHEYKKQS